MPDTTNTPDSDKPTAEPKPLSEHPKVQAAMERLQTIEDYERQLASKVEDHMAPWRAAMRLCGRA